METRALAPLYNPTSGPNTGSLQNSVTVAATNTGATASAALPGLLGNNDIAQMQIANTTTAWAYVNFGVYGAVTAATVAGGYPVAPGAVVVVSLHPEVSGASVILGTAPGSLTGVIFTRGEGQ